MKVKLYQPSMALVTDLYQLTMGYGYWRNRMHDRRAVFHLFFRRAPFAGGYAVAAGLETAVDWLLRFLVDQDDVDYLRSLTGNNGQPLFSDDFLAAITGLRLTLDIDAVAEGTVVFAHEPIVRVTGPLWQCQWVESALLNIINFQTLIATKSARVCDAAGDDSVLEFGLRRAQGLDGAISASRAAYIGGASATSNVIAGRLMDIPVRGTHAHSWVMSFDDEATAFEAYARAMPNNCVFLVDTYDTIAGVAKAIKVGLKLRQDGHKMVGIRLDSGDMTDLSIRARRMLDDAGLVDAAIVASNDLDESLIAQMKADGAQIAVWGVGTNLVTARDEPALGGVYKLAAIQDDQGRWQPRIKLSENPIKTSTPGLQQIRRTYQSGEMVGDTIYCERLGAPEPSGHAVDPAQSFVDLLQPVIRSGQRVSPPKSIHDIRLHSIACRGELPAGVRRLRDSNAYPVRLEPRLEAEKESMIAKAGQASEK